MSTRWAQAGHTRWAWAGHVRWAQARRTRSFMPVLLLHVPLLFGWAASGSLLWLHVRYLGFVLAQLAISQVWCRTGTSFFISSHLTDFASIPFLACLPIPNFYCWCCRHHLHTQQAERAGPVPWWGHMHMQHVIPSGPGPHGLFHLFHIFMSPSIIHTC